MADSDFRHSAECIRTEIEHQLTSCGLLCRVFGRGKSRTSLERKLATIEKETNKKKYSATGRKIQDAIGIRVALYFSDDIEIAREILYKKYTIHVKDSTIDTPKDKEFSVTRYNLIFELPEQYKFEINKSTPETPIDTTFEVQIRSILSEGWHEVEHDLRYKNEKNWTGHEDLSRALNGIAATLETSEWGMRKIFEDLAYRQYKCKNWDSMLNAKFRMRTTGELSTELKNILSKNSDIAKKILRTERLDLLTYYADRFTTIPLTPSNLVFIINLKHNFSNEIKLITPQRILKLSHQPNPTSSFR